MPDVILNQHYPGGVMKQLGDAAGLGEPYDQYAPGGCMGQLHAAAGVDTPLDQYAPGGPLGQVEEAIEGGGGGGGGPEWVPANAVIHIDLVGGDPQGRAWVAGMGEVAVDTLLGSDPNTLSGGGPTTGYDEDDLTADGLVKSTNPPALIGAARTLMVAGATLRYAIKGLDSADIDGSFVLLAADGANALDLTMGSRDLNASTWSSGNQGILEDVLNTAAVGTIDAIAITMAGMRFEATADGFAEPAVLTLLEIDRPAGNPLVAAYLDVEPNGALQSITLYDPLPSTAGLSDLSEVT